MSFKMQCPFCNQKVEAEEEWQGQQAECPCCSKMFVIMKPENNPIPPVINIQINNENQFAKGRNSHVYSHPMIEGQSPRYVSNHMVRAVLALLFCTFPVGFVPIIYAVQVDSLLHKGDYAGAEKASENVDLWCTIAVISSFILGIIVIAAQ